MFRRDLSLALAAAFLFGCAESSGGASFRLSGAQKAPEGVARVYVTLDRLDAHVVDAARLAGDQPEQGGAVDDGWRSVRLPVDRTFDLVRVGGGTTSLGELDVTAGRITELRMVLDEQGDNRVVLKD